MPQLIIAAIVIAAACVIFKMLFLLFIMCSVDLIALSDRMFGSLTNNAALSWTISGFMIGSITYFVFIESRKLNRPNLKALLMLPCIGLIIANIFLCNDKPNARGNVFAGNQQTGTLTTDMNLRSSPSKQSNIVVNGSRGAKITILGTSNEWLKIRLNNNEGYVKSKYVSINTITNSTSSNNTNSNIIEFDVKPNSIYKIGRLNKGDRWRFIVPNEGLFGQRVEDGRGLSFVRFRNAENNTWRSDHSGELQIQSDNNSIHCKVELLAAN